MPPKITPFSFARDLNVGDRTSVQCVVGTGDLPLTFTWLKDNVPIDKGRSIEPGGTIGVGAIRGGSAGPGPAGILSSKTMNNENKQRSRNREAGGSVSAEASAVPPYEAITIRQYDAFNSALSLSTIAPAHNGTYTCRVANGAATVAHSAPLHVNGNDISSSRLSYSLRREKKNKKF